MGTQPANTIGGHRIADASSVFRAFSLESWRDRKKNKVYPKAYYRREVDKDGLSVGLTPNDCVKGLARNAGYCSLPVKEVHDLPHNLEIRSDPALAGHAAIHNVPILTTADDAGRELATKIAGDLARLSNVVTCDQYP